jgi:hypothetical protein
MNVIIRSAILLLVFDCAVSVCLWLRLFTLCCSATPSSMTPSCGLPCARSSSWRPPMCALCRLPARGPCARSRRRHPLVHPRSRPRLSLGAPAVLRLLSSPTHQRCSCSSCTCVSSAVSCSRVHLPVPPLRVLGRAVCLCIALPACVVFHALPPAFCCACMYVCLISGSLRALCRCVLADVALHSIVLRRVPGRAASRS